jgi:DNA damage-binding protein 1
VLFAVTESQKYFVLSWDSTNACVVTEASGDIKERTGAATFNGTQSCIDRLFQCIIVHVYQGMLKVFPLKKPERASATSSWAGVSSSKKQTHLVIQEQFNSRYSNLTN